MKICFCSEGKSMDMPISDVFGRSPFFLIYDDQTEYCIHIENTAKDEVQGAGSKAVQLILDQQIDILITNFPGPHAKTALKKSNIQVYKQNGNTTHEALLLFQKGKLERL